MQQCQPMLAARHEAARPLDGSLVDEPLEPTLGGMMVITANIEITCQEAFNAVGLAPANDSHPPHIAAPLH